jgi:hypothetical protein
MVHWLLVTGRSSHRVATPRLVALLAGLLSLAVPFGWASEGGAKEKGAQKSNGREQVERVLEELMRRRSTVQTVAARLNLTLYNSDKNKEYPLVGVYVGDKDGNMRLRITAVTNQLILDMGRRDDKVEVYLPRKDRYFRGKLKDLLDNQSQLTLLAHIGNARDLFFPCAETPKSMGRAITCNDSRKIVSVFEKPNYVRHRSRRLTLASGAPVVEDQEVYDRFGREVGVVRYREYTPAEWAGQLAATGQVADNPPAICHPGLIALCPHGGPHSLLLQIEEFILNEPVDPSKFDVPCPEDQKVRDLGKALKNSGSLWD